MSFWNPVSNTSSKITGPGYEANRKGADPKKLEEDYKTNEAAIRTIYSAAKTNQSYQPASLTHRSSKGYEQFEIAMKPILPQLTGEELTQAISYLQTAQEMRAKKELSELGDRFKSCLSLSEPEKMNALIDELDQNFDLPRHCDLLNSLEAEFILASKRACCEGALNKKKLDAIYRALQKSPVLIQVIQELLKNCVTESCAPVFLQGAYYLLEKDQTCENTILIEARSKAFMHFINYKMKIYKLLRTGPVLFLSHDENALKYAGYKEDRKKFVGYFKKTLPGEFDDILSLTPKGCPLPPDALEIFYHPEHDYSKNWSIQNFLKNSPESAEKDRLLSIVNPTTAA